MKTFGKNIIKNKDLGIIMVLIIVIFLARSLKGLVFR